MECRSAANPSQAADAASIGPQPGPEYMRPELISGGSSPKSIFENPRAPWLSGCEMVAPQAHHVDSGLKVGAHVPHKRVSWRSTKLGESLGFWHASPHKGHRCPAAVAAC